MYPSAKGWEPIRKFRAEEQAKSKVKKVHLQGKMDEVEGSSLKKHVGCEISGRLDKIHPERENKVRSNEL